MARWFDTNATQAPDLEGDPTERVYRRIFRFMLGFRRWLAFSVGLSMLSSIFITLQPWPIKFLIDGVLVDNDLDLGPLGTITSETDGERIGVAAALAAVYFAITVGGVLLNAASFYALARTALHMTRCARASSPTCARSPSPSMPTNRPAT